MKKVVNSKLRHHKITVRCDSANGEVILVGNGKRSYLWVGVEGRCATHVSGPATLRALAYAILEQVGTNDAIAAAPKLAGEE